MSLILMHTTRTLGARAKRMLPARVRMHPPISRCHLEI